MYAITCCSTADLPAQFYEKTGISYAKFHFSMNGVEYDDDLGLSISPEEFYQQIRQGALPVTSQVNVQQYEDLFEPILRSGKDLIHLTLSSGISGSIGSARIAARELSERYPNRRIQIIDSLAAASGYGLLVEEAYCRQQEGMSFDQLVSWIEENKLKLHHWFFSTDLTHFRRGGRISASSAFFGNMLNICPLMNVNSQGKLVPREKIRGKKRVMGQNAPADGAPRPGGTRLQGAVLHLSLGLRLGCQRTGRYGGAGISQPGRTGGNFSHRHGHRFPHRSRNRGPLFLGR